MVDENGLPSAAETQADFNDSFAAGAPPASTEPVAASAPVPQGPVNVINPDGKLVSIPGEQLQEALSAGYRQPDAQEEHAHFQAEKYGGTGQQLITGLEGAGNAATFGLSTGLETALGVKPEDIRGRKEENPGSYLAGNVAGLVGSAALLPGAGAAGLLGKAGAGAAEAVGLGAQGAGFVSQVGAAAVKGAFENALMQGGEEVAKAFTQDPNQSAETAISDIGMAAVLGGVFGGALGAAGEGLSAAKSGVRSGISAVKDKAKGALESAFTAGEVPEVAPQIDGKFISQLDRPAFEAGDFKATIENSDQFTAVKSREILASLNQQKSNVKEIKDAAARLGVEPLEGMVSGSKNVQRAEDILLSGAPTYSGTKRQALYNDIYQKAAGATEEAIGAGSTKSKAELGNAFKDSISAQLKEQNAPINALYDSIKLHTEVIPLEEKLIQAGAKEIANIPELRIAPSSPEGQLVRRVESEIGNLKTVDNVKTYKSTLNYDPRGDANSNRIRAILRDKLNAIEEGSIESFAKSSAVLPEERATVEGLINTRKEASKLYREQMEKVSTLSKQLGKGRVHGLQDAIHFIDNLPPETVTNRLFAKNNSEFLSFFEKNFPEQMQQMRDYQKGIMKETASKSGEFSPKIFYNKVNELEPEIQRALFSEAELQKIQDAETVIKSFPKNYNPSNTDHTRAFREFFSHPAAATSSNARDFGIERFIKLHGKEPEAVKAATLGRATVQGEKTANNATKAVLSGGKMPSALSPSESKLSKLSKLVDKLIANPESIMDIGAHNPVPEYAAAFGASAGRVIQYLVSQKPKEDRANPLDPKPVPSAAQKTQYKRALALAEQPLSILKGVQDGSVTPQDIVALKAMMPSLFTSLQRKVQAQMTDAVARGEQIPYRTRMGLSLFLGQPLDSTMTPQSIVAAQPKPTQGNPQTPGQPASNPKHSMTALNKLAPSYQTPEQARERRSLKQ